GLAVEVVDAVGRGHGRVRAGRGRQAPEDATALAGAVVGGGPAGRQRVARVGGAAEDRDHDGQGGRVGHVVPGHVLVDHHAGVVLLHVVQQVAGRGHAHVVATGRQAAVGVVVVVRRQDDLLEVVLALDAGRRRTDLLDRGQEQADQDGDDGDDNEQLD